MIVYFDNGSNPFTKHILKCGYKCTTPYSNAVKVKVIRKMEKYHFALNLVYHKFAVEANELIIVFDSNISKAYLEWLKKTYPRNRIIFWYWNPVETSLHPDMIPTGIEKWSYSPDDCNKYSLKYNTTFFFDTFVSNEAPNRIATHNKAVFIGRNKGRIDKLIQLKSVLETKGIICELHMIGTPKEYIEQLHQYYEDIIPYERVIEIIKGADIIIDIYTDPYAGLSLRPMEALFLNKRLITNNQAIVNYDFYNPDAICVLSEEVDNAVRISEFIDHTRNDHRFNIDYYKMSSWFKRFDEDNL